MLKFKFFEAGEERNGRLWFIFDNPVDNDKFFSDLEVSNSNSPPVGEEARSLNNGKASEGYLKVDETELFYRR